MSAGVAAMIAWLAVAALVGFLAGVTFGRICGSKRAKDGLSDV